MSDFARLRTTMVDTQIRPSDVTKFPIIDSFLRVPREAYVPAHRANVAYVDEMMDLGEDRAMLDARTFARMLDAVSVQPGDLVLDVGCGLGYSAAVLARMAAAVVAVEEGSLASEATDNLQAQGVDTVVMVEGPLDAGAAKHAPFDVIILQGAAEMVPDALIGQLAEGGRIVGIVREQGVGAIRLGQKVNGKVSWRFICNADAPILPGFRKHNAFAL